MMRNARMVVLDALRTSGEIGVSIEELRGTLWPAGPMPDAWRSTIWTAIGRIRTSLAPAETVRSSEDGRIRIVPGVYQPRATRLAPPRAPAISAPLPNRFYGNAQRRFGR